MPEYWVPVAYVQEGHVLVEAENKSGAIRGVREGTIRIIDYAEEVTLPAWVRNKPVEEAK